MGGKAKKKYELELDVVTPSTTAGGPFTKTTRSSKRTRTMGSPEPESEPGAAPSPAWLALVPDEPHAAANTGPSSSSSRRPVVRARQILSPGHEVRRAQVETRTANPDEILLQSMLQPNLGIDAPSLTIQCMLDTHCCEGEEIEPICDVRCEEPDPEWPEIDIADETSPARSATQAVGTLPPSAVLFEA